ncbi:hypothetical protein PIB30_098792, partial [Stylosanthes scabra]|nr:hypothetical protein [Stylosanthes scabra]
TSDTGFSTEEATVHHLRLAFKRNQLSSRKLVEFYLKRIESLNPILSLISSLNRRVSQKLWGANRRRQGDDLPLEIASEMNALDGGPTTSHTSPSFDNLDALSPS